MKTSTALSTIASFALTFGCAAPPASGNPSSEDLVHACALATGCGFFGDFSQCTSNLPFVASTRIASGSADRSLFAEILRAGATATSCEELFDAVGLRAGAGCEASHCEGTNAVICGAASSLEVDCAGLGAECVVDDAGVARCAAGPASGEPRCEGNVAVTPNAGVLVRTDCGTDECAVVEGFARCLPPDEDCAFSGVTCEGTVAVRCNVDGERSYTSRRDCAEVFGTCDPAAERDCVISAEREAMPVGCDGTVATLLIDAYYPVQFDCASVGLTCAETSGERPACVPAAL